MSERGGSSPDPEVPDSWHELVGAMETAGPRGAVYVLGANDTGKSTLCRWLRVALATEGGVPLLSCDPGQGEIGPPGAVALDVGSPAGDAGPLLRFVGSVSPPGHLLQTLTGIHALARRAAETEAAGPVCDSSGFAVGDVAREFQFHVIDALRPGHLVALQRDEELEPVLACFDPGPVEVHRLGVVGAVQRRSREERRRRREERFARYFQDAASRRIDLVGRGLHGHVPDLEKGEELAGLLVAPCDEEGFALALGILREVHSEGRWAEILSPSFSTARLASLQFGSLRVRADGTHGRRA